MMQKLFVREPCEVGNIRNLVIFRETDKYLVFDCTESDGTVRKEIVAVCDGCVNVFVNRLCAFSRKVWIVCANILGYGLAALILPALIFEIMRFPAILISPIIVAVTVPLIIIFRRKEIMLGNDLIDGELDKYREKAARSVLQTDSKYTLVS